MNAQEQIIDEYGDRMASTPKPGFYTALAAAQAAFMPIRRDKTVTVRTKAGGTYSFSYAPLEAILRATLPALNKNGFALVQHVEADFLVTTLYHAEGHLSGSVKVMVTDNGAQAYGSALTYSRRYGATLLLGICADDDDDGNGADGNTVTHSEFTGELRNGLPVITPHGEDWKKEDQDKAKTIAEDFRRALAAKNEIKVYKLHQQWNALETQDFYIAINAYMSPGERREAKDIIDRMSKAKTGE